MLKQSILAFTFFQAGLGIAAQSQIAACEYEVVKLPHRSFIYPDTFAVYWRPYHFIESDAEQSISFTYTTGFGDLAVNYGFAFDSLYVMEFDERYDRGQMMVIEWVVAIDGETEKPRFKHAIILNILDRDKDLDLLREKALANYTFENLMLLANAYHDKKCFVNVYYCYLRMLDLDVERATPLFTDFHLRNQSLLRILIDRTMR